MLVVGIICVLVAILLGTCTIGCQSNDPVTTIEPTPIEGDGNEIENTVENESVQIQNTPWPYVTIILLLLVYSYFSKKFTGWGRR